MKRERGRETGMRMRERDRVVKIKVDRHSLSVCGGLCSFSVDVKIYLHFHNLFPFLQDTGGARACKLIPLGIPVTEERTGKLQG